MLAKIASNLYNYQVMYTLTLLIKPTLEEKERQELFSLVTKHFSQTIKEDLWGVRSLAYPIKHIDKAFYVYFEFEAEPANVPVLDRAIKLNEDVIRYLLVKREGADIEERREVKKASQKPGAKKTEKIKEVDTVEKDLPVDTEKKAKKKKE